MIVYSNHLYINIVRFALHFKFEHARRKGLAGDLMRIQVLDSFTAIRP